MFITFLQSGIKAHYHSIDKLRIKLFNIDTFLGMILPVAFLLVVPVEISANPIILIGLMISTGVSFISFFINRYYYHTLAGILYLSVSYLVIMTLSIYLGSEAWVHLFLIGTSISAFIFKFKRSWVTYTIFLIYILSFAYVEWMDFQQRPFIALRDYSREVVVFGTTIFGYKVLFLVALLRKTMEGFRLKERRYQQIFETDTLGRMEIDISELKTWLEELKSQGITSLDEYTSDPRQIMREMLTKIEIQYINQTFCDITGAKNIQEYLDHIPSILTPGGYEFNYARVKALFEGKRSISSKVQVYHLTGGMKYLWVNASFPDDPESNHEVITVIDITQEKVADEKIRKNGEKYRGVFESNLVGIALTDEHFRFKIYNPGIIQATGYTVEELNKLPLHGIIAPESYREFTAVQQKIMNGEIDAIRMEVEFRSKSQESIYTVTCLNGLYDESGNFQSAIATVQDISQQKYQKKIIEEQVYELHRKNQELQKYIESNMQLENFAYIASHDLREPLLVTLGFTKQLQLRYRDQLDDKGKMIINHIVTAAHNMDEQIKALLVYSQVHANEQVFESFDIVDIIQEVQNNLKSLVNSKDAVIELQFNELKVVANRYMIKQLFQNLISNSLKFCDKEITPRVCISVNQKGNFWEFSLKDNGIGIDPVHYETIFILFKRLHNKDKYDGLGMGLAICKKIIEKHQGRIWLASESGKGTTFYFTLPIVNEVLPSSSFDA